MKRHLAQQPVDIAREVLQRLAARRIAPTPDNYHAHYLDIAGEPPAQDIFPAGSLRSLVSGLPRTTPLQLEFTHELEAAVDSGNWTALKDALVRFSSGHLTPADAPRPPASEALEVLQLRRLLAEFLEASHTPLHGRQLELAREAESLAEDFRAEGQSDTFPALLERLQAFLPRFFRAMETDAGLRDGLLRLLRLLVENIGELVVDDAWLRGQIGMLRALFAGPIELQIINDMEGRLRDIIRTQSTLKKNLSEARDRVKTMLAGFIEQLSHFSEFTGDYHDNMGLCVEKISAAADIGELSDVIEELVSHTRSAQASVQTSRSDILEMRARVEQADQEILRLQGELSHTSRMVRHDHLTGVLNRGGFTEVFASELARARRRDSLLCVALLDVDNFKQINDSLGHAAGDQALIHLAEVIRNNLRPQDSLARYGGEEFVILLPDIGLDNAVETLMRLQRNLTRKYFLHDTPGEKTRLLITFSAGVVLVGAEETPPGALSRADAAMYEAKRAGKNRVFAG